MCCWIEFEVKWKNQNRFRNSTFEDASSMLGWGFCGIFMEFGVTWEWMGGKMKMRGTTTKRLNDQERPHQLRTSLELRTGELAMPSKDLRGKEAALIGGLGQWEWLNAAIRLEVEGNAGAGEFSGKPDCNRPHCYRERPVRGGGGLTARESTRVLQVQGRIQSVGTGNYAVKQ